MLEVNIYEHQKALANVITEIQVRDGKSLAEISTEIFGDGDEMVKVMHTYYDTLYKLENGLAKMNLAEME